MHVLVWPIREYFQMNRYFVNETLTHAEISCSFYSLVM